MSANKRPTHFFGGVSNCQPGDPLYAFGILDPRKHHVFWDDFDHFAAGDWTITTVEEGGGSASEALTDGDGGLLLVTNDAADNDADFFQKKGESFKFETGKKLAFAGRFKVSDATDSDWVFGLQITDSSPLAVTDGVFFQKDDGDANIDFHVEKNSTATSETAIATNADNTFVELAFFYDGIDAIHYYVDGERKGSVAVTNLPDDEELTISFGIQNGEAAAKTMSVDYILCVKER